MIIQIILFSIIFNLGAGYWLFNRLGIIQSNAHMINLIIIFFLLNVIVSLFLLIMYGVIFYVCIQRQFDMDELLDHIKEKVHEERDKNLK